VLRSRSIWCVVVAFAALSLPASASATTYLSGGLYPGSGTEYSLAYWWSNQMDNSNSPYAGYQVHLRFRWYNGMASQHMYSTAMPATMTRDFSVWSWPGCWRVTGTGYYTGYTCNANT
jgi:hypothetical protein